MRLLLTILTLIPLLSFSQEWSATVIADSTYNSVLRSMSQGVYDHYSDKSFFCFMQNNSNPYVVSCDHSSGNHTWGVPSLVYEQPSASKYNYPTLDMLPNRKLVLCYASPFDNALGFAISNNPADATSWNTQTVQTGDRRHVEYPRIKVDRRGNIYLFFIHMERNDPAHKRWYYYVKSEDEGATWTEPVLCLQRELDDPYGMCEMYVGYTVEEPFRLGEPERWWFAYTASSGFQFQGQHTGTDNSPNLTDNTANWGDGGNFDYRWLYNVTKGTNSGIISADTQNVFPEQTMDWDNGDEYGIAYHNIYHSDIFVVYYNPETGHWYDAAHNDLGEVVSRAEMETAVARPYVSPIPPSSKDVGYVQNLVINNQGYPSTIHNDILYSWDGNAWQESIPEFPANDIRYIWYAESNYYWAANRLNIYNSNNMSDWLTVQDITLPENNSFSTYSVSIDEGHAEAYMNTHEYRSDEAGKAWAISANEKQTPEAIILRSDKTNLFSNEATIIYAYITDKVHGARSRVRDANNTVQLSVISGNATINNNPVDALNGKAEFTVTPTSLNPEVVVLQATSGNLDSYYINLFVNGGVISNLNYVEENTHTIVYPNPTTNILYLPENVNNVKIIDMQGKIVFKKELNGENKLPINLSVGTYIVQVFTNNSILNEIIIVKN